jgi:hypothetical protein
LGRAEILFEDGFFEQVVDRVRVGAFAELVVQSLDCVEGVLVACVLVQLGVVETVEAAVVTVEGTQDRNTRYKHEDLGIHGLDFAPYLGVLVGQSFDELRKRYQHCRGLISQQELLALFPRPLERQQSFGEVRVVLQLGVDGFKAQGEFAEEGAKCCECRFDPLGEATNRRRFVLRDLPQDVLSCEEDLEAQIVSTFASRVGDGVQLSDDEQQLFPQLVMCGRTQHNPAFDALLGFVGRDLPLRIYSPNNVPSRVLLDQHQLKHIVLLFTSESYFLK